MRVNPPDIVVGKLRFRLVALLCTASMLLPGAARAIHFSLSQVTHASGCSNKRPAINLDGTRTAFVSAGCNLSGTDSDGNFEIYLFQSIPNTLTPITITSSCGNNRPSIDAAGTRIAFTSSCDLTGGNGDGNQEIFFFDTMSNAFTQVTTTSGCISDRPAIDAAGTRIAFTSTCDLTGQNSDHSQEIFLFDTTTSTFTQITMSANSCSNDRPAINAAGTRIAFTSTCDLTGSNSDGNAEIFLFTTATSTLSQITDTSGCSNDNSSLDATGALVTFTSTCDLISGQNSDANQEIFLFDTNTASLRQVTISSGCSSDTPVINAAGTSIAFVSTCDLTGGNGDGNSEGFVFATTTNAFTQFTHSSGCTNEHPVINGDGTRLAFVSPCDLVGGDTDGSEEIFLAQEELPGTPAPALSLGGLVVAATSLLLVGNALLGRRKRTLRPPR